SLPVQRECRSQLQRMDVDAAAFELKSPAILVIGEVAGGACAVIEEQREAI
ncbi:MAG TPA: uroporphyrinogen-III C-methyltransferase, partial [Pseudomonas sp.]|nr:uroporphyrinogen-III C-methyltransferase [Pseudomonas sp.]